MAKFTNYMIMMSGFMLVFYFLDLFKGVSFTGSFLHLLLNPQDISSTELVITAGSIAAAVALAIGANRLLSLETDMVVLSSLLPILFGFGWDFLAVFQIVSSQSEMFAVLLFSPIFIVYVLTVIEWWRGVST